MKDKTTKTLNEQYFTGNTASEKGRGGPGWFFRDQEWFISISS